MTPLRLLIADDHTLVRQGLRRILEAQPGWEVVAETGDGREAVRLAAELRPDVVLLDIAMPHLNGVEAMQQIERRVPGVRVLILSMYADEAYVTRAIRAGASGYLLKDSADMDLIKGISAVAQGKSFFSPAAARVIVDNYARPAATGVADRFESLSEREREVFQLVAEGYSNKEVAELLHISPATVETHRAHVMEKLDLHSTAELVLCAVRRGIVR
jgi:DNA-binding NarL/FixJ family response regulator